MASRGWHEGRNVEFDVVWTASNAERTRQGVEHIIGGHPDVIIAQTLIPALRLKQATNTIPIVFTNVSDPNGAGLVNAITHPGANVTGFSNLEPTIGAKWLELIKEVAPGVNKVVVIFNPQMSPVAKPFAQFAEAVAEKFKIAVKAAPVLTAPEIEAALTNAGPALETGLIFPPDIFTATHRQMILGLATRRRLPAVYPYRFFADDGGLMSYGTSAIDSFAQAATYVDRILRGANPAELPVQAPTKFELVINAKAARALGLTVPPKLLFTAEDVIDQ
jgi:putative ABC transport system substrate-binding protein